MPKDENTAPESRPTEGPKPKGIGTKGRRTLGLKIQLALAAHRLKVRQKNRAAANRAAGFITEPPKDPIEVTNLYAPQLVWKVVEQKDGSTVRQLVPVEHKAYTLNRAARRQEARGRKQPGGHRYRTPVHAVKAPAAIWEAEQGGAEAVPLVRRQVVSKLQRNAYARLLAGEGK